jgi:hypothetical protein
VVWWSEFLATDPEARVRFPALSEKKVVGVEWGPLSLVSITEELLDRKVAAPVYKTGNTAVGIRQADHVAPSIRKFGNHFAENGGRSVGIVRSLTQTMEIYADSDHGDICKYLKLLVKFELRSTILCQDNI